jgi:hypothetical protein
MRFRQMVDSEPKQLLQYLHSPDVLEHFACIALQSRKLKIGKRTWVGMLEGCVATLELFFYRSRFFSFSQGQRGQSNPFG